MTPPATARATGPHPVEAGGQVRRLQELIDWAALGRWGWDPDRGVFAPAAGDPVFGFVECQATSCDQMGHGRLGLCRRCTQLWRASSPGASFEEFCQTAPPSGMRRGNQLCRLCRTPGHERPARVGDLCRGCASVMTYRGQTVEAYLDGDADFPPPRPRPSFGVCQVTACERWAQRGDPALCESHEGNWRRAGRPQRETFGPWSQRALSLDRASRVAVLRGLDEGVQLELLYGLWCAGRAERRTTVEAVQGAANLLRAQKAATILELRVDRLRNEGRALLAFTVDQVCLALSSPATETAKDDWDLRVFGRSGRSLHFGLITQPWLKEAAKCWALERLDTVDSPNTVERAIHSLKALSQSLRRHRRDRGAEPAGLSRSDIVAFSNDLAHLEAAGQLSRYMRRVTLLNLDQFLREARGMGLTGPGRPLAGLAEEVAFHAADRIRAVTDDDHGRALPQVVLDQLLDPSSLQLLEDSADADARAMLELQAEVGRRTGELCGLRWDCLSFDEMLDESCRMRPAPVLVHDMPKVALRRYRLPISEDAAQVIRAQQARVRSRYPDTPTSQLALFPAAQANPRGVKARGGWTFRQQFRSWLAILPGLVGPGGDDYDRSHITPYSLRHCYAQRHADGGTPIEVLAALMGHRKLSTTQAYYRVRQDRKCQAVDLLAALQVDRAGGRTRPTVERLLEAEAAREEIGQVAVPFGLCREPTNVKAQGQACPFRHQCFGCVHFRSDPSYLPELRAYLARLLADRERLRAAAPELEDWARKGAIPSGAEIAAVRRVIDRCEGLLGDLPEAERSRLDEAITVLRRGRAQLDTSVPVRFLGLIGQSTPSLFPGVRREREQGAGDGA